MTTQPELTIEFCGVGLAIERRWVLTDLNLAIGPGEAIALLGRSGSGKTTSLKLINALLRPSQGQVRVQGRSTQDWNPIQLRRRIGYVIQEIGLFPHLSIGDNIGLVPRLEKWPAEQIHSRVREMLRLVDLDPEQFTQRYPAQLSGGQRQRVGVARALAADPPILLMDEPFGALDPITRLELQQQFRTLQQQLGKTVVFVTHDIQEAFFLATRIGLMWEGRLVFLGSREEFLHSSHPEAQAFMACLGSWRDRPSQET